MSRRGALFLLYLLIVGLTLSSATVAGVLFGGSW